MLQIETNGCAAEQTSRSVTRRTVIPLLLLQIKTNGQTASQMSRTVTTRGQKPFHLLQIKTKEMSNLNISICNNNSAKTGPTVTDLDIRNRLISSSKSVTSRPQNGPQILQIETEESLPDFKSQSVTHRTAFPLLLLQIKTNGGAFWQTSRSVTSGTQLFCLLLQIETNL